jgi:hypothetical protein
METMQWPVPKPQFRTRADGVTSGERSARKRGATSFDLWASLYADDCAILFETRADLITGTSYLFNHLRKFGLQMHVGTGDTASKTEAMFFPAPRPNPSDAATVNGTERFDVLDEATGTVVGFINFTTEFKYLGSIIHPTLTSDADVDKRMKAATSEPSRTCSPTSTLTPKSKGRFTWPCVSASCSMAARFGACGRTCFVDYAISTTAAAAPCAALR